jgi:Zn-dependent protease
MKKPTILLPADEATTVGRVFDTSLVVKGKTWFPVTGFIVWMVMTWVAGQGHPERSCGKRLGTGALTTIAILGSEWCHNLAHAAAASLVSKPVDAIRIMWGMPILVYYDINDQTVTPRQHILRALGGPLFNALLLPPALLFKRFTRPGSAARDVANATVGMNAFLSTASLLPIPGIDGGPLLKWSLVGRGNTPRQADERVKRVNRVSGAGLGLAAGIALKKRRWFIGAILGLFAALSWAIGFGLLKEQE